MTGFAVVSVWNHPTSRDEDYDLWIVPWPMRDTFYRVEVHSVHDTKAEAAVALLLRVGARP